jgi:hypothetical protein
MEQSNHSRLGRRPALTFVSFALAGMSMLFALMLVMPQLLYPPLGDEEFDRQGVANGRDRVELQHERMKLQNDARATLLQALGGGVVALSAFFAWKQLQHNIRSSREQNELERQGQITERFTRAIDQLGNENMDVRIGGIYALGQIARASKINHGPVMEILSAYLREHANEGPGHPDKPPIVGKLPEGTFLRGDFQAAVTVLAHRNVENDEKGFKINLSRAALQGATLEKANLEGAYLNYTHLEGADLQDACLRGAQLSDAHLEKSWLIRACLEKAILTDAHLDFVYLEDAHLEGANLSGAKGLTKYLLSSAICDQTTVLPAGLT